jgi:hypothetical protein
LAELNSHNYAIRIQISTKVYLCYR